MTNDHEDCLRPPPETTNEALPKTSSILASTAENPSVSSSSAIGARAIRTKSMFPLRDRRFALQASRKTRLMRFRSTAVPSRLETENPIRAPLADSADSGEGRSK